MKLFALFLGTTLLISYSTNHPIKDNEVIELPIQLVNGYGPFHAGFGVLPWKPHEPNSTWGKTQVEVGGIPENWNETVVQQIWFDARQFAYQNYQQGNIDEDFFNELKASWNIDLDRRPFSETPIKCFTHIVMGKTETGEIIYKIDSDNDRYFADEPEMSPFLLTDSSNVDSLAKYAHSTYYEAIINDSIQQLTAPILILQHERGLLMSNIAQHAETNFQGFTLKINAGFNNITFDDEAALCIYTSDSSKVINPIRMNEFIAIGDDIFQNLGVNFNKQTLSLKKMSSDTVLFSTQIGFYAKPFEGKEFTTGEAIRLADYQGKYLYLEFWGSWCGPCIKEIPNLKAAYNALDTNKIEFLGVALDKPEALKKTLEKEKIQWPQILSEKENSITDLYGIGGYPTSFLIDAEGKIVAKNLRDENLLDTLSYYIN